MNDLDLAEDELVIDKPSSSSELLAIVRSLVEQYVRTMKRDVTLKQLGFDERAAGVVYVDDDSIVIPVHSRRSMDYYGGFEYVDSQHIQVMGGYVFYSREDSLVDSHLSRLDDE